MRFVDFKMRDLVGKTVVWTTSDTIKRETKKIITKISETNQKGFRIDGHSDRIFSYRHGHEILPDGRKRVTYSTISVCQLITEEQAQRIRDLAVKIKDRKELIHFIMSNTGKMHKMPVKDLKAFVTKMKKVDQDGFKRES